jgi:hypothetical protein
LAVIVLGFANLAVGDYKSATEQARLVLNMGTTVGLWELHVVTLILVRQNPCDERYEQFYEQLALQSIAAPMCDSPSYREIVHRLQPPGLAQLPPEQRAAAEARGRELDIELTLARLRQWFEEAEE